MADNQVESNNSNRGGRRLGAGRKVRNLDVWMAARGIKPASASEILANSDERRKWHRVLNSEDDRVVLQALVYLMSMRDGKPAQAINVTSQSITLHATDIEQARAIVAEIRNSSKLIPDTIAPHDTPSLGHGPVTSAPKLLISNELAQSEAADSMLLGDDGGKNNG